MYVRRINARDQQQTRTPHHLQRHGPTAAAALLTQRGTVALPNEVFVYIAAVVARVGISPTELPCVGRCHIFILIMIGVAFHEIPCPAARTSATLQAIQIQAGKIIMGLTQRDVLHPAE